MRHPYREIDEIEPDSEQHIQVRPGSQYFNIHSPMKQVLQPSPLYLGILQVAFGLVSAGLGGVEVFLVPILIDIHYNISLNYYNCYGAAIWSGFLLVLAGSCAIRAHIKRDKTEMMRFYLVSLFAFIGVLAFFILTQVCYTKWWTHMPYDVADYYVYSLLGTISNMLGLLMLIVSVTTYFKSAMFGQVKIAEAFVLCCFPCCSEKVPSHASSVDSVHSGDSSLVV